MRGAAWLSVILSTVLSMLGCAGAAPASDPGADPGTATEPELESETETETETASESESESESASESGTATAIPSVIRLAVEDEAAIDALVHATLDAGGAPGAVVILGRRDGVVFRRAYGWRAVEPDREPMTVDTIFDLASVTKAVATATSVMRLVERGSLDLDAPLARYLPELRHGDRITARHLLTHTSGLPAVNPLTDYDEGDRRASLAAIYALPLEHPPGARVRYSDLGFVILGELVARISGQPLDRFARDAVFAPLGMRDTRFVPPAALRSRIAPTERAERRGDVMIRGVVHDPRAWRLGGVSGNAGLFSTGDDLARFARAMLDGGATALEAETVRTMTAPQELARGRRGLGWDLGRAGMSDEAFGHGGFTGTSLWIDPERDAFFVLLSNRVHPDGVGDVSRLSAGLAALAGDAAARAAPPRESAVLTGVDVLERDGLASLDGARVALLTHAAARTRDGRRTLDVLHAAPNVELVRIWAPEHGLASRLEGRIREAREPRTGLPVHSLFGRTRAPTDAMLEGVDTIVVDLQDVGVRFYTYASTVRRVLEVAAARELRVVILDRPDPLGGGAPAGPVSEPALASFVNHHPLPPVHGMTLGELATLLNAERSIDARLDVVEVEGWRRGERFEATGLRWVPPSPNLRTKEEVLLYPALGMLEGTNVSVGRGTETPFEVLGAPWIEGEALASALGPVDGVTIASTRFTPRASRHRGRRCEGLRLQVTDVDAVRPVALALRIAVALRRLYPSEWDAEAMAPMLGRREVHARLLAGDDAAALLAMGAPELAAFAGLRARYLRY